MFIILLIVSFYTDTQSHSSGISLMQIDCEVVDTHLINVKHQAIPQHFKPSGNNTTKPSKNDRHNEKLKKPYKPYFLNNVNNSTDLNKLT